jgi:putative lipoprotein
MGPRGAALGLACATVLTVAGARADTGPAASRDPDPWFGSDKAAHFGAAFVVGCGGYGLGVAALEDRWAGVGLGATLAIGLGAVKEGLDAAGLGRPSLKDFAWDVVGALLGVGVSLTFDAALRGP